MKNIQTTLMLDKEIFKMIKEEAEREDRTVSAQIRYILKNYYKSDFESNNSETKNTTPIVQP